MLLAEKNANVVKVLKEELVDKKYVVVFGDNNIVNAYILPIIFRYLKSKFDMVIQIEYAPNLYKLSSEEKNNTLIVKSITRHNPLFRKKIISMNNSSQLKMILNNKNDDEVLFIQTQNQKLIYHFLIHSKGIFITEDSYDMIKKTFLNFSNENFISIYSFQYSMYNKNIDELIDRLQKSKASVIINKVITDKSLPQIRRLNNTMYIAYESSEQYDVFICDNLKYGLFEYDNIESNQVPNINVILTRKIEEYDRYLKYNIRLQNYFIQIAYILFYGTYTDVIHHIDQTTYCKFRQFMISPKMKDYIFNFFYLYILYILKSHIKIYVDSKGNIDKSFVKACEREVIEYRKYAEKNFHKIFNPHCELSTFSFDEIQTFYEEIITSLFEIICELNDSKSPMKKIYDNLLKAGCFEDTIEMNKELLLNIDHCIIKIIMNTSKYSELK